MTMAEHGRAQLADAAMVLIRHQYGSYGLCQCDRPWPCSVNKQWVLYARYWQARLNAIDPQTKAMHEPTRVLRLVKR